MGDIGELFRAVIREGTHLAESRDTAGAFRGSLLDDVTNVVVGQAEFVKVDPSELASPLDGELSESARTVLAVAVVVAVSVVATIGAIKAAPYVKRWWTETALPAVNSTWSWITGSTPADSEVGTSAADFSQDIDVVLEDCRTSMSSAEAQKRLLSVLIAAAFIAEQMRALSQARIEEDHDLLELQGAMRKLTTKEVANGINAALERNTSLLDDETSAVLMRMFGGGRIVDGKYMPLLNTNIEKALAARP